MADPTIPIREGGTKPQLDNSDRVAEIVKKALEGGLASATLRAVDSLFQEPMMRLRNEIAEALAKVRIQ